MADLLLPPPGALVKTNEEDPVEHYYGITAPLYRGRLAMATRLLGRGYRALLDVGYGSGIFFPELARRSRRLAGVELHEQEVRVATKLGQLGLQVDLRPGSILDLPFDDASFDAVVCLSVLEHLRELDLALHELERVLEPGGVCVLGFPVRQPVTDAFFRLMGHNPRALHPSSHSDILDAVRRNKRFALELVTHFPRVTPLALSGYAGVRLRAA